MDGGAREACVRVFRDVRAGRPTIYHESFCDAAYMYALKGATDEELAEFFRVPTSTLYNWYREHPELMEASTRGKGFADAQVSHSLYMRSLGFEREAVKVFCHEGEPVYAPYTEYYPPDTTAATRWLANRQRHLWGSVDPSTVIQNNISLDLILGLPRPAVDRIMAQMVERGMIDESTVRSLTLQDAEPRGSAD